MRITFLATSSLDYPSPRGRWLPLAQVLVQQGFHVRFMLLHHEYDRLPVVQRHQSQHGVVIYYISQMHVYGDVGNRRYFGPAKLMRVSLVAAMRLAHAATLLGGDAVHVCKPQPINGLAGLVAAKRTGTTLLVDCDDYEAGGNRFAAAWQRSIVRVWEDYLPRYAARMTVNTRFLQQRYESFGIPAQRITYVPNGITPKQLEPPNPQRVALLRQALGLEQHPVVIYVGTLSSTTHHVAILLDAFALVIRRMPNARLLLVGDGEDRHALETHAQKLEIATLVRFIGAVPYTAVPIYFALATCSVDPVVDDDVARARSPLKIVESLAAGVPVVTSDVGDRAEILGHSGGVLVEPGSAEALAEGVLSLLSDSYQCAYLADGARARAADFLWEKLAHEWATVYRP